MPNFSITTTFGDCARCNNGLLSASLHLVGYKVSKLEVHIANSAILFKSFYLL